MRCSKVNLSKNDSRWVLENSCDKCQRCGGMLVSHECADFGLVGTGRRCLNCGFVLINKISGTAYSDAREAVCHPRERAGRKPRVHATVGGQSASQRARA